MSTISYFLPTPPDGFSTTLSGSIGDSTLTIPLNSVSGLPTEGVGVLFKKGTDGTVTAGSIEYIHWTNVSGNSLTLSDTGDRGLTGSSSGAQAYSSGDYFEVWVSSYYHKSVKEGALVEHSQDGTHDATKIAKLAGSQTFTGAKTFGAGLLKVTDISDSNGNEVIKTPATASAVNEVTVTNAATGGNPSINPTGDDTNISMTLEGKGTGKIEVEIPSNYSSLTSTTTTSTSYSDVTGSSFSFTIKKTSHVKITFAGSAQNNTAARYFNVQVVRDSTSLGSRSLSIPQPGTGFGIVQTYFDTSLAPGTYTYKLQLAAGTGGDSCVVSGGILFAEAIIA